MKLDSCTADTEPCANENTNCASVQLARWSQLGGGHYCTYRNPCYTTLISRYRPHVSQSSLVWFCSKDSTNDAYLASNINLSHLGLFAFDCVTAVPALYIALCYVTADLSPTQQLRRQLKRQCMLQYGVLLFFSSSPMKESDALPSSRAESYNSLYGCAV